LFLRHVSDLDASPQPDHAGPGLQQAHDQLEQRCLPRAVRPNEHCPLPQAQVQIDAIQQHPRAISEPEILYVEYILPAARRVHEFQFHLPGQARLVDRVFSVDHPLQSLLLHDRAPGQILGDAPPVKVYGLALDIPGLVAQPADRAFELAKTLLLLPVCGPLLVQLAIDGRRVVAVTACVFFQRVGDIIQRENARDRTIEERAIVRDDQHRARIAGEIAFQPLERNDVEVVGRLVEQQQVRLGQQQARQAQPRLLSTAQAGDRPFVAHIRHAQSCQHSCRIRVPRTPAERLEFGQRPVIVSHRSRQIPVDSRGNDLCQMCEPRLRRLALSLRGREHIAHRGIRSEFQRLRQVPGARGAGRKQHMTAVRGQLSRNDPQQGRFPRSVRADQPRGLAPVEREVDPIQDLHVAKPLGDISNCQHRLSST